MAYSDHVGWGHTWLRSGQRVRCQCGLPLPITADRSLPRDQKGQLTCALAMDLLAKHGMILAAPDREQGTLDVG